MSGTLTKDIAVANVRLAKKSYSICFDLVLLLADLKKYSNGFFYALRMFSPFVFIEFKIQR